MMTNGEYEQNCRTFKVVLIVVVVGFVLLFGAIACFACGLI